MDVKEAVKSAITCIRELFESEKPSNIGLEEVNFNENEKVWEVTIGFSRSWDYPRGIIAGLQEPLPKRQYKVVKIDSNTGEVKSIKIREAGDA